MSLSILSVSGHAWKRRAGADKERQHNSRKRDASGGLVDAQPGTPGQHVTAGEHAVSCCVDLVRRWTTIIGGGGGGGDGGG